MYNISSLLSPFWLAYGQSKLFLYSTPDPKITLLFSFLAKNLRWVGARFNFLFFSNILNPPKFYFTDLKILTKTVFKAWNKTEESRPLTPVHSHPDGLTPAHTAHTPDLFSLLPV